MLTEAPLLFFWWNRVSIKLTLTGDSDALKAVFLQANVQ